jgi:threonine/homoserine/homoserine lactone efflux protein
MGRLPPRVLVQRNHPKILVFYLSLLPQFVDPTASVSTWLAHAWTLPIIGTLWCLLVVCLLNSLRRWLEQKPVRRTLDAVSGLVMLGFCAKLAREA